MGRPYPTDHIRRLLANRFPLVDGHPDVAGVLRDAELLASLGPALAEPFAHADITKIVAPEARGPILGALVALHLGAGLVLARKADGNHPGADRWIRSQPTWRGDAVQFQARSFDLVPDDRVLIVDDWITTGATADAMAAVVAAAGASVLGVAALVDKADSDTRARLAPHTLVRFDEIT